VRLPERSITVLDRDGSPGATIRLGVDVAVNDAVEELRPLVGRDSVLWQARRDAAIEFREARMRMGAVLLRWRRGIRNDQAWGRILRALDLNRHTVHQACRLAAELCDEWGAIDLAKVDAAKARAGGMLRRTAEGQRLLEAEPGQMRLMDLRRLLRAGKTARRTDTGGVDARQHLGSGYERAAPAAGDGTCVPGTTVGFPAAPGRTPTRPDSADSSVSPTVPTSPTFPEPDAAGARLVTPPGPAVSAGGAGGAQLHFDFEAAASRVVRRVTRLLEELAIDPDALGGRDLDEGAELLGRLDAWLAGAVVGAGAGVGFS